MRRIAVVLTLGALMLALTAGTAFAQQGPPTLAFEVVTEGEVPQDTSFSGLWGPPESEFSSVQLTDPDEDGVYTAQAYGAMGTEIAPGEYVVRIDQGASTIYGPETITLGADEVETISTTVDFTNGTGAQGRVIYGTAGSDYLTDTAGDDVVYALGSGDTISSGYGDDALYGGYGWDYVGGGYGNDILYGWEGSDWLDGGADNDTLYGWTGDDRVDGGSGDDVLYAGVGDDALYGSAGSDVLYGWEGSDYLYSAGDGTYDQVYGWTGYDVCVVGPEDLAYGCEELYRQ